MSFEGNPVARSNNGGKVRAPQYGGRGAHAPHAPQDRANQILMENLKRAEEGPKVVARKAKGHKPPSEEDLKRVSAWKKAEEKRKAQQNVQEQKDKEKRDALEAKLERRRSKYNDPEGWKRKMKEGEEVLARRKGKLNTATVATEKWKASIARQKAEEERTPVENSVRGKLVKAGVFKKPKGVVKVPGRKTNVLNAKALERREQRQGDLEKNRKNRKNNK